MIKIMVDSASDCRNSEIYDEFVPINVSIGGKDYLDGVDLDSNTFYELLVSSKEFPKTAQPSPDTFVEYFEKAKEAGDEIIYLALSSSLSGTYQSARIAKSMVEYDGIYVLDTLGVTHMIGQLAQYAAKLVKEGYPAREIATACEELKSKVKVYAGVETLEYLRRGGRLSGASAAIGTLANIKPIVTVTPQGAVESVGKGIGIPKAMSMLLDKVKALDIDERFPVISLYTYGEENVAKLEEKAAALGINVTAREQIGSTIGAHVGPGVYGICVVTK